MTTGNDTYRTIERPAEGLFKDKGSRFLAFAYPIQAEEEVKPLIQALKKEHFSARHHCFAWRLGPQGEKYRANDDGEPSGTAGRPILGQLLSANLSNILVVVVRYFGGTLLGVSGLINAYKCATADVLAQATPVERLVETPLKVVFEYPLQNQVMKVVKDEQLEVLNAEYRADCLLTILVRNSKLNVVIGKLTNIDGVVVESDL